jgi:hypothetical protein
MDPQTAEVSVPSSTEVKEGGHIVGHSVSSLPCFAGTHRRCVQEVC